MRRFDTIAARTMGLLLLGLGLFHVASVWVYQAALTREITANDDMRITERLLAVRRSLLTQPVDRREDLAHEMSGGSIDAHFGTRPLAVARPGDPIADALRLRLLAAEPELARAGLVVGSDVEAGRQGAHQVVASLGLGDGSFANVSIVQVRHLADGGHATVWSTSLMALGVILASLLIVRWITGPLRALGAAARAVEQAPHSERLKMTPLVETGPREVAETARAFNDMQARIASLLEDRTLSLAAISHDLKTPLTRLRLQIEDIGSVDTRQRMTAEIAEMEAMIDGTLAFLRGAPGEDDTRLFDVRATVESICADLSDQGYDITVSGARHTIALGHPLQIKRALTNLIQNAVRHGGRTQVRLAFREFSIEIAISDDGPGIPADQIERARRPFERLDSARSSSGTGGGGLGLAIAERFIVANGGAVSITNREPHGLEVLVNLVKRPPAIAS